MDEVGCGLTILLGLLFALFCIVMAVLAIPGFHPWWMQ